jgi:16S rRNA (guanine1207-N2)-methyltransferase
MAEAVYGSPPAALVELDPGAVQLSPFVVGSTALEAVETTSMDRAVILAPPGTVERRYAVAHALRALKPKGELVVLAPKDKGGSRLKKELQAFGCELEEWSKAHHRVCVSERPEAPLGVEEAIAEGAPRLVPSLGLWSQPGVFSWDRPDPGSLLLIDRLPPLSGEGADLGCGVGLLAKAVLPSPAVTKLHMLDLDRRAVEAAGKNITDPRAEISWADATEAEFGGLDFVVMNPPFHGEGHEDRKLGIAFIHTAAAGLRKGGTLWMVANRHLPYEPALTARFHRVTLVIETGGYKVYEAVR